ncbi:TPA: choline ABC transporter permease, partial [Clostridioides difficile]|nr:choline ABC transporter permease [Clostridioides difficile]
GLALFEPSMIITATILVTAIALIVDYVLSLIEKWVVPKGLKVSR